MAKIMRQFLKDEDLCPSIRGIFSNKLIPCSVRQLREGEILWHDNEPHPYCYLIERGMIKLHVINRDGKEKVLFYYTNGSLLGFQSLSKEKMTMTTATAILPTRLYVTEFALFYNFILENPEYLSALTSYIFHHMAIEAEEIVNISIYNTAERLAALFVLLAEEYPVNSSGEVVIPFKNEDLAAMIGACRNSVSNALSAFNKDELIVRQRGSVIITDLKRLKEYAL
ncbi:MAG TPA: Crp/Fnr family transcriptional regulator [Desulfitobacterium dehalogenans]|uniref:Crp/Fnr family transcriptional regulator n=1 Tax=Desulfitobacterium dehalogenans TaxID=36854 RepID=A0A7C7DBS7_9FIRM|nr:Crp/Fnr family transcriptional regulator [Desulfitobacterium dehalogenans]